MPSSSRSRIQSPPPPSVLRLPPPPVPLINAEDKEAPDVFPMSKGPSVKLVKSCSMSSSTPMTSTSAYDQTTVATEQPTSGARALLVNRMVTESSQHQMSLPSSVVSSVLETPVPSTVPTSCENERSTLQPGKGRLEPRCSGYVRWTRPHPPHPGREFIYVCPSQYRDRDGQEIKRLLGELDRMVARSPWAEIGRRMPDGWVVERKGRVQKSLSSLGELKRSASTRSQKRAVSAGSDDILGGEDRTNFRKRRGTVAMPGGAAVIYEKVPNGNGTRRSKHGRITNSGAMRRYAQRGSNTSAMCVNDVEQNGGSKGMTLQSGVNSTTPRQKRHSRFTEHLVSGALQSHSSPPPRIGTPKAGSLHFDPRTFQVQDESSPSKDVPREKDLPPDKMSVRRPRSQSLLHGKNTSISSMIALAATTLRSRSRSPVKKSYTQEESSSECQPSREISLTQNRFRRFINVHGGPRRTSPSGETPSYISDVLRPVGVEREPQAQSSDSSAEARQLEINEDNGKAMAKSRPPNPHSKSISITSTTSNAKSDEISATIGDARAVTLSRPGTPKKRSNTLKSHPESPGPAPSTPLPPVPEILPQLAGSASGEVSDNFAPRTPRNSISSQLERRSPRRLKISPEASKLHITGSSPEWKSQPSKPPAVTVRIRAESFPKPPSRVPSPEKANSERASRVEVVADRVAINNRSSVKCEAESSSEDTPLSDVTSILKDEVQAIDFALRRPVEPATSMIHRTRPTMPRRARTEFEEERHRRRDSHVTEEILSWYSDGQSKLEDPFVTSAASKSTRADVCSLSPIIVNSEQIPMKAVVPQPITASQPQGATSLPLMPSARGSLGRKGSTTSANGFRPSGLAHTSCNPSGSTLTHESRPVLDPDVLFAHEKLLKVINRSSMHSSQPSSQRSSLMDDKIEARLSRVEKALVAVLDAQRDVTFKSNVGLSGADGEEWVQSGRQSDAFAALSLDDIQRRICDFQDSMSSDS